MENGEFTQDISQISFNEIPTLDRDSANYLGDRQMGTLSDMVSQFDYSNSSTQINYQGRPVRVAPIAYADLIKWFTNRGEGLPAYVVVDMVTQEAQVSASPEGQGHEVLLLRAPEPEHSAPPAVPVSHVHVLQPPGLRLTRRAIPGGSPPR